MHICEAEAKIRKDRGVVRKVWRWWFIGGLPDVLAALPYFDILPARRIRFDKYILQIILCTWDC